MKRVMLPGSFHTCKVMAVLELYLLHTCFIMQDDFSFRWGPAWSKM